MLANAAQSVDENGNLINEETLFRRLLEELVKWTKKLQATPAT
jgi:hypothetical protein